MKTVLTLLALSACSRTYPLNETAGAPLDEPARAGLSRQTALGLYPLSFARARVNGVPEAQFAAANGGGWAGDKQALVAATTDQLLKPRAYTFIPMTVGLKNRPAYAVVPWMGDMALGYYAGAFSGNTRVTAGFDVIETATGRIVYRDQINIVVETSMFLAASGTRIRFVMFQYLPYLVGRVASLLNT